MKQKQGGYRCRSRGGHIARSWFVEFFSTMVWAVGRYAVAPNERVHSLIATSPSRNQILNASKFCSCVTNILCILLLISRLARMSPVHPVHKENEIYSWSDCACTRQNFSLCVEPRKSNLHMHSHVCWIVRNRRRNYSAIIQRISCPPKSSRPTAMNHLSYFLTPTSTARIDFE